MPIRIRKLLALAAYATTACSPAYEYRDVAPGPKGIVETPVRDYPFGDAVDVYRAALDLLYLDGEKRPSVIVMHDSALLLYGGSCAGCPGLGAHKAAMDTSTIEAFVTMPRVQPRLRKFDYDVPIVLQPYSAWVDIEQAGALYDSTHRQPGVQPVESPSSAEFRRRFPGAWGAADFGLVAFNRAHTEALLPIRQSCGDGCLSDEIVFFKKTNGRWRPIERMPRQVLTLSRTRLVYRGPNAHNAGESELLIDQAGASLRPDSKDAPGVYRAVLDSLYSFHGERPRMVVIGDEHAPAPGGRIPYKHRVDSSTKAAFAFQSAIEDPMNGTFSYRVPVAMLSYEARQALGREGIPLEREANLKSANEETSAFWLAFRKRYPTAWGYVDLSRIAYNPEHTEALVFSVHRCGATCENGDTWLAGRRGETWAITERIENYEVAGWRLDSLRYVGRSADPTWYRSRRAHGVFSNAETGAVLPFLDVTFTGFGGFASTVRTDSAGRYTVDNLPLSSTLDFKVSCPISGRSDTLAGPFLMTRPGLDTTLNIDVRYRGCTHLNREHPLISGTKKEVSAAPDYTRLAPDIAGVYRGVLDALYPLGTPEGAAIMLEGFTHRRCEYCLEAIMPRLIRERLIDPSTEVDFARVRTDTSPPSPFSYRRRVEVMPVWDRYWLGSDMHDWGAMKDAYPGVNAVVSFSAVGFNDHRTEGLVEIHVDSARASDATEIMLLKKTGAEWRVALRHVEGERISSEWSRGKCEPTDVPAQPPSHAQIESLIGDIDLIRVGASRQFRGRTDTVRVRLEPVKPVLGKANQWVGKATVINAAGKSQPKIAAALNLAGTTAVISFRDRLPPGVMQLDGWLEEYEILRISGSQLYGTWFTVMGPTVPLRGYFCARRVLAR
jgi:hypothetical protein